jgi:hypothetical protein
MTEPQDSSYEPDEPVSEVLAEFDAAADKGVTASPFAKGGPINPTYQWANVDDGCALFIPRKRDPERTRQIREFAASWYRKPDDGAPEGADQTV